MSDPRATPRYEGIGAHFTTYLIDNNTITYAETAKGGSSVVGRAVTLVDDKIIALAADGDAVLGRLESVEWDGAARVQDGGFCSLPAGASATLTPQTKIVGALGPSSAKGYIRDAASTAEEATSRAIVIDATTTTKVIVEL